MEIIITNNPLVGKEFQDEYNIIFLKLSYLDVLIKTRDFIHKGHRLLTHPLSSSVKPNETVYKSILISKNELDNNLDLKSLNIIEESIITAKKFHYDYKEIDESTAYDFQLIDLDIFKKGIEK